MPERGWRWYPCERQRGQLQTAHGVRVRRFIGTTWLRSQRTQRRLEGACQTNAAVQVLARPPLYMVRAYCADTADTPSICMHGVHSRVSTQQFWQGHTTRFGVTVLR